MKKVILFVVLFLAAFAPSQSFAVVNSSTQTFAVAHKKTSAEPVKKSTWVTLICGVAFIGLAYVLKAAGASVGLVAACYVLALVAVILCIGTMIKK